MENLDTGFYPVLLIQILRALTRERRRALCWEWEDHVVYQKVTVSFSDVNECELNMTDPRKHGCEYECIDVAGGYACKCRAGYRFHADLRSCRGEFSYILCTNLWSLHVARTEMYNQIHL